MQNNPSLRQVPLTSLRRVGGETPNLLERRERRAVAESHAATKEISEFLGRYSPAHFVGTDGKTYETEAILSRQGVASTLPWSISMNGLIATIVVPICSFQVVSGPKPPFTISGRPVDYTSNTANTLVMSDTNDTILLECTVDDTQPSAINTLSVEIIAGTRNKDNTMSKRYIAIASVQLSSGYVFGPYVERKGLTTARRGDRQSTANMVWF